MDHHRPLFSFFILFKQFYLIKTVDFSGIRTEIFWIENEIADHLTTTTTQFFLFVAHCHLSKLSEKESSAQNVFMNLKTAQK